MHVNFIFLTKYCIFCLLKNAAYQMNLMEGQELLKISLNASGLPKNTVDDDLLNISFSQDYTMGLKHVNNVQQNTDLHDGMKLRSFSIKGCQSEKKHSSDLYFSTHLPGPEVSHDMLGNSLYYIPTKRGDKVCYVPSNYKIGIRQSESTYLTSVQYMFIKQKRCMLERVAFYLESNENFDLFSKGYSGRPIYLVDNSFHMCKYVPTAI